MIGASIPRKEDPPLLRGQGRFGADFARPGQLWARVVRSPVAHGRLRSIGTAGAARQDGVITVVTTASLPPGLAIPVRLQVAGADLSGYLQPVLAAGLVRYVGEPVAVVVAADPYAAEDAAELVDLDIDEAPAVLDAEAAATADAPRLFPGGNVAADFTLGYGDVADAFARADRIVEIEVKIGRHGAVPLEPRALLADPDPGTGGVRVLRYLVAYEVGRAVNPALVAGQLRGGAAQGIGGALPEEFCYDENGQPQSATFMDYRIPTAAEVPPIDVLITQDSPAPGNPLGVRGAGEGGVSAAGAVLASAVRDALGLPGSVGRLPLTPARVQELATNGGGR